MKPLIIKNYFVVLSLVLVSSLQLITSLQAQQIFPSFTMDGRDLPLATVGGLSSPQFSEVDLNNDGTQDLYVFDKIGQVSLTFLNKGTPNIVDYSYAPEYLVNFPKLSEWVMLRDYNGDGIKDIFAYSSTPGVAGIEVYTGYYTTQNQIAFRPFQLIGGAFNIIYYPGGNGLNNLYVSNIDYPAVDDIDGDGDLDIVTFNIGGGIVELFTNQSVERGFGLDSLQFVLEDKCWGRFYESGISLEIDLSMDQSVCATGFVASEPRSGGVHSGSTVTTIDMDNDGDKEVILGDISFTNLNMLSNGGDASQAFMTAQDITFPRNTTPVDIPLFPAAYILDINNDGLKDLVAAPNLGNDIGETAKVGWYYANINTNEMPVFDFRYNDFLVGDMVDFGTGAYPTFVDYNADGLQDLVIGNKSFFVTGGDKNARIYLFENIGTKEQAAFTLIDDDYLGLNDFSNSSWRFAPTFGDLDSDGDLDVLIGEEFGNLFYAENIAGPNKPFAFGPLQFGYQDLDVGQVSKPQIIDINQDGLNDLVIGERNGNLNYFENIGTPDTPIFEFGPTNKLFGKVDTRDDGFVTGYSAPNVLAIDGALEIIAGTQNGTINRYLISPDSLLAGTFEQTDSNYMNLQVGAETHLAFADLDGDGLQEMVVGNIRGGISFYKTDLRIDQSTPTTNTAASIPVSLFPNPAKDQLSIQIPSDVGEPSIRIYNSIGQLSFQLPFQSVIPIADLANGIYFVELQFETGRVTKKFLKMEK